MFQEAGSSKKLRSTRQESESRTERKNRPRRIVRREKQKRLGMAKLINAIINETSRASRNVGEPGHHVEFASLIE